MLDELVNALQTIKQRMEDHAAALETNEALTRMALIDPLLRVLGWLKNLRDSLANSVLQCLCT